MTDHGDNLSRRYRELAREEPPAALDDAILAASRRAVSPRSRMRWAAPVSIAAVLVLGIGVALRMQVEQPGIETSAPTASPSEYAVPTPAEPLPASEAQVTSPRRAEPAKRPEQAKQSAPPAAALRAKRLDAPPDFAAEAPAVAAAPAPAPASPPVAEMRAPAAPPPASITVPLQSAEPQRQRAPTGTASTANTAERPAALAKREAFAADSVQRRELADKPRDEREVELERIAKLRGDARHEEADKALEEFRRRYPDYRIAPAMWERVKPRS